MTVWEIHTLVRPFVLHEHITSKLSGINGIYLVPSDLLEE